MSLPMGRGTRQVRSGGLVRKRDDGGRAAKVRDAEQEVFARVSDILLHHDSSRVSDGYRK
jgi:hypothetical protein